MKINFNGIRFNMWLSFFAVAMGTLLILGILQISLIKPYYRNIKVESVGLIIDSIAEKMINIDYLSESNIEDVLQLTINNNACIAIYNDVGNVIYQADSLGSLCMFNDVIELNGQSFIPYETGEHLVNSFSNNLTIYSLEKTSEVSGQEMIIYGEEINDNLANYYVFVNSPLEPIDSIISFFTNQLYYLAFIVTFFALMISIYVSKRLASPIIDMKKSANRLMNGDYNTYFSVNSYSEINDLANTLNDVTNRLGKIDELRTDLIANISHDIKTPLTMIKAYAEMIKDISGDDKIKREEHLDVIMKESDFLNQLVTDMQTLGQLQSDHVIVNRINFNLSELVEDIYSSFNIMLAKANIYSNLIIEPNIICYGDTIKLSRVIYNFISNAIKHSYDKTTITIKLTSKNNKIRFEVIDQGVGISETDLPYIWDRYYKIDKQFKRNSNSTGLGLAISKAILDSHNAKYGAISKRKKGSTFYFELDKEYTDGNL